MSIAVEVEGRGVWSWLQHTTFYPPGDHPGSRKLPYLVAIEGIIIAVAQSCWPNTFRRLSFAHYLQRGSFAVITSYLPTFTIRVKRRGVKRRRH